MRTMHLDLVNLQLGLAAEALVTDLASMSLGSHGHGIDGRGSEGAENGVAVGVDSRRGALSAAVGGGVVGVVPTTAVKACPGEAKGCKGIG